MTLDSMTLSPRELLAAGADILEKYDWCQGAVAQDKEGRIVPSTSPYAAKFCAMGSLFKVLRSGISSDDVLKAIESDKKVQECTRHFRKVTGLELVMYSETEGRTKEEVIEKMRFASKKSGNWFKDLYGNIFHGKSISN
jgi:hypothetical protein